MALQPGTTPGPDSVAASIGEGGMRRDRGGMSTDRRTEWLGAVRVRS